LVDLTDDIIEGMTTNTKDFDGAVLVIADPDTAAETAAYVAKNYFSDSPYHFTVTESTPTSFPESTKAKTKALQESVGAGAMVLTVYPWAATENTLHERTTHGQIPS
jgi:hypothetical protein